MQVNIPDGTYTLEDGRKMTVSKMSMFVYPADTEILDVPDNEKADYAMSIKYEPPAE